MNDKTSTKQPGRAADDKPMQPVSESAHGDPLPDGTPEMAANQHYETVNAASTRIALVAALDYWEKSGCDCCCPTVADDAIDAIGYDVAFWERMRHFAVELAQTAQNIIDQETQYRDSIDSGGS